MTDKELRRLSRTDLLEMLLEQSKEVERLQQKLEEDRQQLEERRIMTEEADPSQKPHFGSTGYLRQHRQPQTSTWRTSGSRP